MRGDVFRNVVVGFQNPFASAFYILAMLALGLHMYHGFWSMLQTLGLSHPRWNRVRRGLSLLLAGAVVAGNISIPLAVLRAASTSRSRSSRWMLEGQRPRPGRSPRSGRSTAST